MLKGKSMLLQDVLLYMFGDSQKNNVLWDLML
jgi:hypothetical protein